MRQKHNISEKAYAHFISHIRRVFSLTGQGGSRAERAIRALNEYIEGTRHDFDNVRGIPEVQLALMMLQPEIDKCLARSAAARARARARAEARTQQRQEEEAQSADESEAACQRNIFTDFDASAADLCRADTRIFAESSYLCSLEKTGSVGLALPPQLSEQSHHSESI